VLDPATINHPRLIALLTAEGLIASAFATEGQRSSTGPGRPEGSPFAQCLG